VVVLPGLFVYFVVVCACVALLVFPILGAQAACRVKTACRAAFASARDGAKAATRRTRQCAQACAGSLSRASGAARHACRRRASSISCGAAVLLAAPLAAVMLRQWHPEVDAALPASVADPRIASLLQGEELVPPAPLPPALFLTPEVMAAVPLAGAANRDWNLLDRDFRQRLVLAFRLMRERHGYEMVLVEGFRSARRQEQLAALGPQVTQAAGGQSWHQFGLAADCAFRRDGRIVVSERDPWAAKGYALFGAVAASVGLEWGGAWKGIVDLGHVQLARVEPSSRARDAAEGASATGGGE
jgi:peptidoglycan L-alanyl-D-glutamate endopeptidase CwlK